MAEVRGQPRQARLHVCADTVPSQQAMDGERMAQVMQARLTTGSVRAPDTDRPAQLPDRALHRGEP